jgi:hypothetical protein
MATLREYAANRRLHAVFCGGYRRGDGALDGSYHPIHTPKVNSTKRKTLQCLHSKVDHNNLLYYIPRLSFSLHSWGLR